MRDAVNRQTADDSLPTIEDYFSANQLRSDRWSLLREIVYALVREGEDGRARDALTEKARTVMTSLRPIEAYWAFPGPHAFGALMRMLEAEKLDDLAASVRRVSRALTTGAYRRRSISLRQTDGELDDFEDDIQIAPDERALGRPYFEVLVVDDVNDAQARWLQSSLTDARRSEDPFVYQTVVVPSLEDALIAVLLNHNVQAVLVRPGLGLRSRADLPILQRYIGRLVDADRLEAIAPGEYGPETVRLLARIRPELDTYMVTERAAEDIAGLNLGSCRRVFYNQEDFLELHLNILRGVRRRFRTPFFTALKAYSREPTGVFHALPISRGKSISSSHWIQDMGSFYGPNIFLAETSATSGGLDSLLEPKGPIKEAQELAARAFGAKHTYFVTNGTSTANKIVVQALVRPGDIVIVDRDCHKSHHYGLVLSGARVVYLDSYPLDRYSMYGAVPLAEIKARLLHLRREGQLHRVRMVLLTNCTFDGLVYNVERVMAECLAIKPDLVFLWDEAWFGFARFAPVYRQRTAMAVAHALRRTLASDAHRAAWEAQRDVLDGADDEAWMGARLLPPPQARVRAYATQSTHKTLTALRQGSMIHVHDQDFKGEVEQSFAEAYMTHTSTSPNYQIIASLDVGRRQVEFEGYEFVQRQIECAMSIRKAVATHPNLKKYFRVLRPVDMIPDAHRESGMDAYYEPGQGWTNKWDVWADDEFVLDPTRITLAVGDTGWDGSTFKAEILMDRYGIQVNKTSRNTVLFMTNIGTTRSSVAYLIEVLVDIARELDERYDDASDMARGAFRNRVESLTEDLPPLPDFSRFHDAFRSGPQTDDGEIRGAFFLAYDAANCAYRELGSELLRAVIDGEVLVSASFVTPYPPGFPILVPGQVISGDILRYMRALDTGEIHGYRPELGLRVFTEDALDRHAGGRSGA